MTGVVYRDPMTGRRRLLGGANVPRQAQALEKAGWVLVRPTGFDPHPPQDDLAALDGISEEIAGALSALGLRSFDELRAASDETLLGISGIGPGRLRTIRESLSQCEISQPES